MKAYIETRTKPAKGTWPKCGPGKYVAVQIVPDGVEPLKVLNRETAKRRGIKIVYCGEYYWNRTGPRSAYAEAMNKANRICNDLQIKEERITYAE